MVVQGVLAVADVVVAAFVVAWVAAVAGVASSAMEAMVVIDTPMAAVVLICPLSLMV